ncbi:MAG: transposase [Halioglobus sp.]
MTATAIVAALPDAKEFRNGRRIAAWLGRLSRQSSSGDKQTLLGISKRGNGYLRTLLTHLASLVFSHYKELDNNYIRSVGRKKATLSQHKRAVALANKNALIIWSMLNTAEDFSYGVRPAAARYSILVGFISTTKNITSLLGQAIR